MKMTKREKVMLIVLFPLIVIFIYLDFFIKPRFEELRVLREEKYLLQGEISKIEHTRNFKKLKKANDKELSTEISLLSRNLFEYIEEDDAINIVDKIIKKSGINIRNMSISTEDAGSEHEMGKSFPKICVALTYKDSFHELMRFISQIESYNKVIIIRDLSIACEEAFEMTGGLTLELYYIDIDKGEENEVFYPASNRVNPFTK
ncbi:hypothetical protein [Oceanirhabdus sp. W0125-5]|uniref:hypothetical protein n=1 Tax=Oceanirhabdus sp. W0125-5 TaxID=2999116 RepID=UPI0022F2C1CA|nr:hypothetical protein [Oceanirhabdus sp. W0125-5]WBW96147.1 hypothetical protein OW730_21010 [Oceanirhabdus sp. W0125-5]